MTVEDILDKVDTLAVELAEVGAHAEAINEEWQRMRGESWQYLVHGRLRTAAAPEKVREEALETAMNYYVWTQYPYMRPDLAGWLERAKKDLGVPLRTLFELFRMKTDAEAARSVHDRAARYAKKLLPSAMVRSNTELRISGPTVQLEAYLWEGRTWDPKWYADPYVTKELQGLEIVTQKAAGGNVARFRPGVLARVIDRLPPEGGKALTGWHLIPEVRPFKNGRLDVTFKSAELAQKVADVLTRQSE